MWRSQCVQFFYISNQYGQTAQIQPRLHYMSLTYPWLLPQACLWVFRHDFITNTIIFSTLSQIMLFQLFSISEHNKYIICSLFYVIQSNFCKYSWHFVIFIVLFSIDKERGGIWNTVSVWQKWEVVSMPKKK